ncbi:DNA/pantothenate metabolism flavoprotein [Leptospira hartskeerlii]|uniref:DNA/pantothenate metabolism flavoprotein n=1 Tax=Leptospira hartskeerlii TaxID=2023177 RepID=A0A2M9X9A6_9LEPT|nr:phosphopantothenoylcysteine decarboxylase [Leptospira hartskeerlii]PJZ24189.1 DNA/pantothenate metabolism flavoprotein [Leptospira hartskeerlii]PJZ35567.1 DNA/pantothenate metabolism flavoprotein [Leptospira hartskeerlii]
MKYSKIIISSGPTREWIDPVRFISNASSGKMGYCLAQEAANLVKEVVYIRGLTEPKYSEPKDARIVKVETTLEMRDAILNEVTSSSILIMAAAPADFRPKNANESKIKKEEGSDTLVLELIKNPDILVSVNEKIHAQNLKDVLRIGFSAETDLLDQNALGKLERKNLDFIVGNYVGKDSKGFGDLDTSVIIYGKEGSKKEIGPASKEMIAKGILEYLDILSKQESIR